MQIHAGGVSTQSGMPRTLGTMYSRRTLHKLFKPCMLTLLRHSYISHMLAHGQLTVRDREQLAAEMCHSPASTVLVDRAEEKQHKNLS